MRMRMRMRMRIRMRMRMRDPPAACICLSLMVMAAGFFKLLDTHHKLAKTEADEDAERLALVPRATEDTLSTLTCLTEEACHAKLAMLNCTDAEPKQVALLMRISQLEARLNGTIAKIARKDGELLTLRKQLAAAQRAADDQREQHQPQQQQQPSVNKTDKLSKDTPPPLRSSRPAPSASPFTSPYSSSSELRDHTSPYSSSSELLRWFDAVQDGPGVRHRLHADRTRGRKHTRASSRASERTIGSIRVYGRYGRTGTTLISMQSTSRGSLAATLHS